MEYERHAQVHGLEPADPGPLGRLQRPPRQRGGSSHGNIRHVRHPTHRQSRPRGGPLAPPGLIETLNKVDEYRRKHRDKLAPAAARMNAQVARQNLEAFAQPPDPATDRTREPAGRRLQAALRQPPQPPDPGGGDRPGRGRTHADSTGHLLADFAAGMPSPCPRLFASSPGAPTSAGTTLRALAPAPPIAPDSPSDRPTRSSRLDEWTPG